MLSFILNIVREDYFVTDSTVSESVLSLHVPESKNRKVKNHFQKVESQDDWQIDLSCSRIIWLGQESEFTVLTILYVCAFKFLN